jgi:hypothetical protein
MAQGSAYQQGIHRRTTGAANQDGQTGSGSPQARWANV